MSNECDDCGEHALECGCSDLQLQKSKIEIYDVEFTVRTGNLLRQNGIKYLNELTEVTSRTLLQWRNMGKKSLNEIREKLAEHGLALKDEVIDIDVKKTILHDLPKVLGEIKMQVDQMQNELRFFAYKIDQIAHYASKTKKKVEKLDG